MENSHRNLPKQSGSAPTAGFDRFSAIPGLLITSSVCYTLLGLQLSKFRGSEALLAWSRNNRPTVTIAVQVLSQMLGLVHVQVICALIRTSFVLLVASKPFPIYLAQFVQAASTPRLTWALLWRLSIPLLIIVAASFVPAAMWAGAVTPLPAERNTIQMMNIPTFETTNISTLWEGDESTATSGALQWMTNKCLLSFDPASVKGSILQAAADASVGTRGNKVHAKLDKTGYSYIDRSYATGSIAGLTNFTGVRSPSWYTYKEVGFISEISCFYNNTFNDEYGLVAMQYEWGLLAQAIGTYATGDPVGYVNYYGFTLADLFAWGPCWDDTTKTIIVQFTTLSNGTNDSWAFAQFNNMQCNIEYKPEIFDVYVNTTSEVIASKALGSTERKWPDWGSGVIWQVHSWLRDFSFNDACVGGCQIGRSLVMNVNRLQNATNDYSDDTVLQGTEDYLAAMTDSIMTNLLLTRMISNAQNSTTEVSVTIGVPALVFGDMKFIIIVVVLNVLISAVYTIEFIRTRAWAGIPPLDFPNICDALICASKGGMLLAQSEEHTASQSLSWKSSTWTFSNEQPFTEKVKMCLRWNRSMRDLPALVPLLDERNGLSKVVDGSGEQISLTEFGGTVQQRTGLSDREQPILEPLTSGELLNDPIFSATSNNPQHSRR